MTTPRTETSSSSFRMQARALRPVSATIISYGRSSKIDDHQIDKSTTLYVIRVSRGGQHWFVAKRYSEFRALYELLRVQLAVKTCPTCRELASFYGHLQFPSRHRLRSSVGFAKHKLAAERMDDLNQFVRVLMEMTQGLLDDDEEEIDDDGGSTGGCEATILIREFLMVPDDYEDIRTQSQRHIDNKTATEEEVPQVMQPPPPPRLSRKGSSVSSFRVQELDILYKEKEPQWKDDSLGKSSGGDERTYPLLADVFADDDLSPPDDAFIHRQSTVDERIRSLRTHPLGRHSYRR